MNRDKIQSFLTPDDVLKVVDGYPHISFEYGKILYNFIIEHKLSRVLELGFSHGVSSCYAGAAVKCLGQGSVVTIDRLETVAYRPGLENFVSELGLDDIVIPIYESQTYNWRLKEFLRMEPRPVFDLIFIDGAHMFEPDALAFLLSERMLRPGGWFIFDDINWSISTSVTAQKNPSSLILTDQELKLKQVREVIDVVVRSHPNIASWHEDPRWGYARKREESESSLSEQTLAHLVDMSLESREHAVKIFPLEIQVEKGLRPTAWKAMINRGVRNNVVIRQKKDGNQ